MSSENMIRIIQSYINEYVLGMKVEKLVSLVYWKLVSEGYKPVIINDRYLELDGAEYCFRRNRKLDTWIVKAI